MKCNCTYTEATYFHVFAFLLYTEATIISVHLHFYCDGLVLGNEIGLSGSLFVQIVSYNDYYNYSLIILASINSFHHSYAFYR